MKQEDIVHEDLAQYFEQLPELKDEEIDLGLAALAISALSHPERSMDRYINHLQETTDKVGRRFQELCGAGAKDNAGTRLAALKDVLNLDCQYKGDVRNYNKVDNADLVEVIERRKGLPVALAILYMTCALRQGWTIFGLNFPAHFVTRIDCGTERIIFDPFYECKTLEAADLRETLKAKMGPAAELSADYYTPISHKAILIRLQNNLKLRYIEAADYANALKAVEIMRHIDPEEYRLFLDAGVLYAKTGQKKKAISSLEEYIGRATNPQDREEAALMVRQLKESLN